MINPQEIIENSLLLEITNPTEEGLKAYWECEQALSNFLAQKITFRQYVDTLWDCGVGIDEYLTLIDNDLRVKGI